MSHESNFQLSRRHFFQSTGFSLGSIALGSLGVTQTSAAGRELGIGDKPKLGNTLGLPGFGKAKRVIYIHQAGSPPQHETFDYKPVMKKWDGKDAPDLLHKGKTFAFIKGVPKILGPRYPFAQHGESGIWMSNQFPNLSKHADKLLVVKSFVTDQFNHAPAQLMTLTGQSRFGYPSMGSWVTYGLGSGNENLPGFVVLLSGGKLPSAGKNAWGAGFLPSLYQGVQCRTSGDPVLNLSNPKGMSRSVRRESLDALNRLNSIKAKQSGNPETGQRMKQYELAYRMQIAAPEVMDISKETKGTLERYNAKPGGASFANNCLLARRLLENGVRFVQLFDWGWDVHGTAPHDDLMTHFPKKCKQFDAPVSALLEDLEKSGLLEDTLVVCCAEFGRTAMNEARNGSKLLGRDHHPDCASFWMAGGGLKSGISYGESDEFAYKVAENPVRPHDLQATILHLLGMNPFKLSFPFQGLDARLIGPTDHAKIMTDWIP